MHDVVFDAPDEAATERFGQALAAALAPGTVIALAGTLGAGKTRLVQAVAAALGAPRQAVVSPTFVLCQEYPLGGTIPAMHHLDAYRLRDEDELRELGIDELLASDGVTILEWADRVAGVLPDDHVRVAIDVLGPTARRLRATATGPASAQVLSRLASALGCGNPGQRD
jgi:tRNA threonylcarbamoyladenosine biosynthesis protein TsaE